MAKLTPQQFVLKYKPFAIACMKATGLHYHATLTQAALESGWGEGATMFGIKDTDFATCLKNSSASAREYQAFEYRELCTKNFE